MSGKRYYWLKLKDDFFSSKRIKKLRKLAGGDTYTIIYLKMQLLSLKSDGVLQWTGLEDDFATELALDLDESPENVAVTLQYLLSCGLAETQDDATIFFPWVALNTGSETASTQRVREYRARQALQCNTDVTQVQHIGNAEKEIEKELELETEKESIPTRTRHGEYGWVLLTDDQYAKLEKDLGKAELDRCIRYVDESAQSNGNKNKWKDWNLVLRRCHREGWGRREGKEKRIMTFMDLGERERNDR